MTAVLTNFFQFYIEIKKFFLGLFDIDEFVEQYGDILLEEHEDEMNFQAAF